MTRAIAHTFSVTNAYRTQITASLLLACMLMVGAYAFNVYRLVSHTVSMQNADAQVRSLSGSVQSLDSRYLELSGAITPNSLSSHGFAAGKVSEYISRPASQSSLALGGHEL